MRRKTIAFCILVIAALSLMVWACGRSEPAPTPLATGFTPTPYVPASGVEGASTAEEREPTPTPVPPQAREAALEFAIGHRAIGRDWDRFHADFDAWREGLVACDPGSVQVALARFASSFAAVAEEARGLPRAAVVRELADEAIAAAQREEPALRHLRDNWEPEAAAVFEEVAVERSAASELRQGIEDRLEDLQIRTSLSSRDQAVAFSGALQQLTPIGTGSTNGTRPQGRAEPAYVGRDSRPPERAGGRVHERRPRRQGLAGLPAHTRVGPDDRPSGRS